MKKTAKIIVGIIIFGAIVACGIALKKWYIKNDSRAYADLPLCLINVLDQNEFNDAHIAGSINIEFEQLSSVISLIPKNKPVIFYCANYLCTASSEAAVLFIKKGFKKVYVYEGGMAEWYQLHLDNEQFKFEGPAQLSYLQVIIPPPHHETDDSSIANKHTNGYTKLEAKELQKMLERANLQH